MLSLKLMEHANLRIGIEESFIPPIATPLLAPGG